MQTSVTPGTPDSAGVLIGAAANAAADRRNKSIMNCFRDRTPSYSRSRSIIRFDQQNQPQQQHTEAIIYLKEPRFHANKLALLKSSSTRDLSRLMEMDSTLSTSTTSSSSSQQNHHRQRQHQHQPPYSRGQVDNNGNNCDMNCQKYIKELRERIATLEQDLYDQYSYTKDLETKVNELNRRVDQMYEQKRKKQPTIVRKETNGGSVTVQPSKFAAWMNLSNWWKQRPSIETLKEQNIYNDEPCFDTEIEMVLKHEIHRTVPKIVVDCCDLIEEKYRKAADPVEGIYRQCGDYNKIQTLRFKIDANDYESLRQPNIDIHTLTGVLKLFLREIKSPLVSTNEAKTFIGKPNQWLLTELAEKIDILKRLIRSLPEVNRDTMEYIFSHFNKLTKVPLQQVSAETLSLSVTPPIFHTVQQGVHMQDIHQLLKESEILADCVKTMIEYRNRIFECTAERKQRRISVRKLRKTLSHPDLIFQNLF